MLIFGMFWLGWFVVDWDLGFRALISSGVFELFKVGF